MRKGFPFCLLFFGEDNRTATRLVGWRSSLTWPRGVRENKVCYIELERKCVIRSGGQWDQGHAGGVRGVSSEGFKLRKRRCGPEEGQRA